MKYKGSYDCTDDGKCFGIVTMTDGDKSAVTHKAKFATRARAETWVKHLLRYHKDGGQPKPVKRF